MFKKISSFLVLSTALTAFTSFAEDYYLRADAALSKANSNASFIDIDKDGKKTTLKSKFKDSIKFNLGIGYQFDDNLRMDTNISQSGNYKINQKIKERKETIGGEEKDIDTYLGQEVKAITLMVNGYYDFDLGLSFKPYVTAGVGASRVSPSDIKLHDIRRDGGQLKADVATRQAKNSYNFVWQIGTGISYLMQDNVNLDASYRYTDHGKIKYDKKDKDDASGQVKTHDFMIGIRVDF